MTTKIIDKTIIGVHMKKIITLFAMAASLNLTLAYGLPIYIANNTKAPIYIQATSVGQGYTGFYGPIIDSVIKVAPHEARSVINLGFRINAHPYDAGPAVFKIYRNQQPLTYKLLGSFKVSLSGNRVEYHRFYHYLLANFTPINGSVSAFDGESLSKLFQDPNSHIKGVVFRVSSLGSTGGSIKKVFNCNYY